MNVLVFGASGGTGRELVSQGVEQGHAFTAFVRNPAQFELKHPNIKVVKGDIAGPTSATMAGTWNDSAFASIKAASGIGAQNLPKRAPMAIIENEGAS